MPRFKLLQISALFLLFHLSVGISRTKRQLFREDIPHNRPLDGSLKQSPETDRLRNPGRNPGALNHHHMHGPPPPPNYSVRFHHHDAVIPVGYPIPHRYPPSPSHHPHHGSLYTVYPHAAPLRPESHLPLGPHGKSPQLSPYAAINPYSGVHTVQPVSIPHHPHSSSHGHPLPYSHAVVNSHFNFPPESISYTPPTKLPPSNYVSYSSAEGGGGSQPLRNPYPPNLSPVELYTQTKEPILHISSHEERPSEEKQDHVGSFFSSLAPGLLDFHGHEGNKVDSGERKTFSSQLQDVWTANYEKNTPSHDNHPMPFSYVFQQMLY